MHLRMRHFYASVLLNAGESIKAVARSPLPVEKPQAGGLFVGPYFFLPWVLTARFLGLVRGVLTSTDLRSSGHWWSLSVVAS
jgi:hypothetical protein